MKDDGKDEVKEPKHAADEVSETEEGESDSKETSPKINFDYKHQDEGEEPAADESETPKENQPNTLDDLAQAAPKGGEEPQSEIPNMRYQQKAASDVYSKHYDAPTSFSHGSSSFGDRSVRRSKSSPLPLIVLLLVGVVIVGGTVFVLKNRNVKWQNTQPSSSPFSAVATPTPSPNPVLLDRST